MTRIFLLQPQNNELLTIFTRQCHSHDNSYATFLTIIQNNVLLTVLIRIPIALVTKNTYANILIIIQNNLLFTMFTEQYMYHFHYNLFTLIIF